MIWRRPQSQPSDYVALGSAAVAVGSGAVVLLGWLFQVPALRAGWSAAAIHPVMALVFLLAGAAIALSVGDHAQRWIRRSGTACATAIFLLGLLQLGASLLGLPTGVDGLLFAAQQAALKANAPKPLNSSGAIVFLVIGIPLLLLWLRRELWRQVAKALGSFLASIAVLAFIGYLIRLGKPTPQNAQSSGLVTLLGLLGVSLGITGAAMRRRDGHFEDAETRTIRRRVNVAFVVSVVILVATGSMAIWSSVRSRTAYRLQDESAARRVAAASLLSAIQDIETGQRGYLLTGNPDFLAPYRHATDVLPTAMHTVDSLFASDPVRAARLDSLHPLFQERVELGRRTIALQEAGRGDSALAVVRSGRGRQLTEEIRGVLGAVIGEEDAHIARWEARMQADDRVALMTNVIAAVLAVTFLVLAGLAINQDFAHRGKAEAEVRETGRRMSQIVELIPDMVFLKEAKELRFARLNKAAEDLLGYSRGELLGKNDYDFFPEEEARQFTAKDREVLRNDEVLDIPEESIHTRNGVRLLHTKKVTVRDEKGQPLYLLGISQDITESKQIEAALREAKENAEAANRAKSDFLAKMSHELRTPLNSIIGFSEILEDQSAGSLNEKQRRYIGNVLLSGRNLLQLINDILDLSKVEAGRMELAPTEFQVRTALDQVGSIVGALADKKHLSIRTDVPEALSVLTADQAKFKQIMFNLLGNAIKFTPDGGRVEISARELKGSNGDRRAWLEVSVSDTGIGIAPEDHARIFNEFEQVGPGSSREQQGTGLGLALTRKLVELHGGRIWVESDVGRGSTFRFTLPLKNGAEAERPGDVGGSDEPLILVVDDEPQARDLLSHYLTEAGYQVVTAANGKEAIRLARTRRPSAITMDMLLREGDGLQLIAELKQASETHEIPVVVVSVTDEKESGISVGAAEWLVKPIHRVDLITALERAIGPRVEGTTKTVLIVDDDPQVLEYLDELLKQRGFAVLSAGGGQAGIDLALAHLPDLIILDLAMPNVNGVEVVQTLRRHPEGREIPILILTAMELSRADRRRLRALVRGIVAKGQRDHLLDALRRICPLAEARA